MAVKRLPHGRAGVRAQRGFTLLDRGQRGFTLLEMLIVLVIVGVLVSAATLSVSRNPHTDLKEEAQRLALLFESASDDAQIRSRPIAWQPVDGGYRFDIRTPEGWRPLRDDLLAARHWQAGVSSASIQYEGSEQAANRVVFGLESIETPIRVTLYSSAGQVSIVGTGNGRYEVY